MVTSSSHNIFDFSEKDKTRKRKQKTTASKRKAEDKSLDIFNFPSDDNSSRGGGVVGGGRDLNSKNANISSSPLLINKNLTTNVEVMTASKKKNNNDNSPPSTRLSRLLRRTSKTKETIEISDVGKSTSEKKDDDNGFDFVKYIDEDLNNDIIGDVIEDVKHFDFDPTPPDKSTANKSTPNKSAPTPNKLTPPNESTLNPPNKSTLGPPNKSSSVYFNNIYKTPPPPRISEHPIRSISEVGTPISFLSFHRKKTTESVWDIVETGSSPINMSSPSSRKQKNLKMESTEITTTTTSTTITTINQTHQNLLLPYEEDPSFDSPTYGQRRTILGQDLDSLLLDSYLSSGLKFNDNNENGEDEEEKDFNEKSSQVKSSHELREVGEYTRFTDEMVYILDGLRKSQPLNVRRTSSDLLINESGFMEIIVGCLNSPLDPFSDDNELKRSERLLIKDMKEIIRRSTIFSSKSKISLKSIALRILSSLTSLRTRYENLIKRELKTSGGLISVMGILKTELEQVSRLLSKIENVLDLERIEQCLRILEYAAYSCEENQIDIVEMDEELLQLLLEFLLYCQLESYNDNSHITYSEDLTKLKDIEIIKEEILSHMIALLINLAEMDTNNHDEFRKVEQNPNCPGTHKCLRMCTCSSRESTISCLVSLYNHQLEKSEKCDNETMLAAFIALLLVSSLINFLQLFHFHELIGEVAATVLAK
ncbi:11065_t:CDS:10 [Diversispora eburnea]|uniref:11065_t:CDS:1 n=1 Tax=Diversispora eburnea TaxID=1213867 RepID=A0A9N9AUY1_9GLOM|nr:11065_t:CDS:10 [Diversispora eburnea]